MNSSSSEAARAIALSREKSSFRSRTRCSSCTFVATSCAFFWTVSRNSRELSMEMAACVDRTARISASSSVNSPRFLFSTWTTPMVLPRWFFRGAARMLRVR